MLQSDPSHGCGQAEEPQSDPSYGCGLLGSFKMTPPMVVARLGNFKATPPMVVARLGHKEKPARELQKGSCPGGHQKWSNVTSEACFSLAFEQPDNLKKPQLES